MDEIEIEHGNIGVILRCVTKYFDMTIKACSLCEYKAQGLQETFVVFHHHSCKVCWTKICNDYVNPMAQHFSSFGVNYDLF